MKYVLLAVIILLILVIFVLVGIAAFSTGGVFNSIINSLMPIFAAFGMGNPQDQGEASDGAVEVGGYAEVRSKSIIERMIYIIMHKGNEPPEEEGGKEEEEGGED